MLCTDELDKMVQNVNVLMEYVTVSSDHKPLAVTFSNLTTLVCHGRWHTMVVVATLVL